MEGEAGAVEFSLPASLPYRQFGGTPKRFFSESVTPAVAWFLSLASETSTSVSS